MLSPAGGGCIEYLNLSGLVTERKVGGKGGGTGEKYFMRGQEEDGGDSCLVGRRGGVGEVLLQIREGCGEEELCSGIG